MDSEPVGVPKGDGTTKYAIIGLLLLIGGGGAIYTLTRNPDPPPPPRTAMVVDAGTPSLPLAAPQVGEQIELPPEAPDAGPPPDVQNAAPRIRYVTRYVDACPGTVDIAQVQRVAQMNYGSLRACYERELRSNNTLRGPLTAQLKINTSGHVEDVQVSTPMRSRALVDCVKTAMRRLRVPASRGGCALAQVRFNFSPSN
ncbi:MAG: AgmX/PglI C-terminal domain-containing protein [Polyangiales bacterium]